MEMVFLGHTGIRNHLSTLSNALFLDSVVVYKRRHK